MTASAQVSSEARLTLKSGPLAGPVLARVVGMLAARALCPVDRLDDAVLVADAIAAHTPQWTVDGTIGVMLNVDPEGMTLAIGPLREGGASALLADADLPGVGNVLERVASEVATAVASDGSGEELRVRLAFAGT